MNIEFHYYITKYLALNAGFAKDEAEIIAYSSQFVDDNIKRYEIAKPDGDTYRNYVSQCEDPLNPDKKLLRTHLLYHFLPGNPILSKAQRLDGKMHVLMTTPTNSHASEIFYDTTRSENLYSLGIASHMFADTISNQNFVGVYDELNAMAELWDTLEPTIGHAAAGIKPDVPNLIWTDIRLRKENQEINNPERIMLAAQRLYSHFIMTTFEDNNWSEVKEPLMEILSHTITEDQLALVPKQREERIAKYKTLMRSDADYDPKVWFEKAVQDSSAKELKFKKNFKKTNWFRFQEAIRAYQRIAQNKLMPILTQMEIKGW